MGNVQKIIEQQPASEISVFNTNDKEIAELGEKYKGLVISDTKTYDATKAARTQVVSIRTGIDKARLKANAPLNKTIKANNAEANRLTALVAKIEEPLQETVKAWEDKKAEEKAERERIEAARIDNHKKIIQTIIDLGRLTFGASEENIALNLQTLNNIIVDDSLEEFETEASEAFGASQFMLEVALDGVREIAKQEAIRKAEQERQAEINKANEAKLAKEREEFEAQQAQLKADQKKLDDEKKYLSDWDNAIAENKAFNEKPLVVEVDPIEAAPNKTFTVVKKPVELSDAEADKLVLISFLESVSHYANKTAPTMKTQYYIEARDLFLEKLEVLCL